MLKLVKRGKKGIFQVVGTISGHRVRESTGTDSERHAEAYRIQLEKKLLDESVFGKQSTATFAEAVTLYIEQGHSNRFTGRLVRHFGQWRLADITQLEVSKFAQLSYPKASPQTLDRQVYTPLIAVWRCAHDAGLCGPHGFKRPKKPEREAVTFATDDVLLRLLPVSSTRLRAALLLLSFTGARASEACRVSDEAGDIDWDRQTVLLRRTKSGKPRLVPLAPMAFEALLPLKGTKGPLFGFKQRWSLNQAIARSCRRAKMPVMTSHQVGRHAFAARLLRLGSTLKEVQEAGGWSAQSFSLVASVYGHLERSALDETIRAADKHLTRAPNVPRSRIRYFRKLRG